MAAQDLFGLVGSLQRLGVPITVVTTPETELERLREGMRAAGGSGEGGLG